MEILSDEADQPEAYEQAEEEEVITPSMAIRSMMFDLIWRKGEWKDRDDPNGVVPHMEKLIEALKQALGDLHRYEDVKKALAILKSLD